MTTVSNLDELRSRNVRMIPQQFLQGGAIKPSAILGTIGTAAGAASIIPGTAIITAPVAAIAGLGASIAKLFGGSLTQREVNMIMQIKGRVDQRRNLRGIVGSDS